MSLELKLAPMGLPEAELERRLDAQQKELVPLWRALESLEDEGEQTVVVVPSLTVDYAALEGSLLQAYEERLDPSSENDAVDAVVELTRRRGGRRRRRARSIARLTFQESRA